MTELVIEIAKRIIFDEFRICFLESTEHTKRLKTIVNAVIIGKIVDCTIRKKKAIKGISSVLGVLFL